MQLPDSFRDIIKKDDHCNGILFGAISNIEPILKESKLEFFSEYTKHDLDHFEKVLLVSEWLISDDKVTLLKMGAHDVLALTLSILLHDLGMHITYEGFQSLLIQTEKINEFDEFTWSEEWAKYIAQAKRWNEQKLISIFGKVINVEVPPNDKNMLTEYHKKFIGEFLRKNHARLAHEIAIFGFPGPNSKKIQLINEECDDDIKDIIGLIARSHGLHIRQTFSYLRDRYYEILEPYKIKVVFIMILLRLADYLDITSDRAPEKATKIKEFSSPFSKLQWKLHDCIKNCHKNHLDPETLYIQAKPSSSQIYLELNSLLTGIQDELDKSWAILGEVYGRYDGLKELKIGLRRIQSNIFEKKFNDSIDFLPEKISFTTDSEVLKHLIAPLYGENPSYGVRELMQNAIDACKEHEFVFISRKNDLYETYEPSIELSFYEDNSDYYFSLNDNGIGMSHETLINYFFKAGASFRKSTQWLETFSDQKGNSSITRSGKFGVGVLAAFLLGNEISITTKHLDSNTGFTFNARIEDEQIEVKKVQCKVGTSIVIKLSEKTWRLFKNQSNKLWSTNSNNARLVYYYGQNVSSWRNVPSWNQWFLYSEPHIEISIPDDWKYSENKKINLGEGIWHTLNVSEYSGVHWSYSPDYNNYNLVCNGFLIPSGYSISRYRYPIGRNIPTLLITDNNGVLPLSLNRNTVEERLSFEVELLKDIYKGIIIELITNISNLTSGTNSYFLHGLNHPLLSYQRSNWGEGRRIFLKNGYCLPHSYFINKLEVKKLVKVFCNIDEDYINYPFEINDEGVSFFYGENLSSLNDLKNILYENDIIMDKKYRSNSRRIYIHTDKYHYLFEENRQRLRYDFKVNIREEFSNEKWTCLVIGDPSISTINEQGLDQVYTTVDLIIEYDDITEYKGEPSNNHSDLFVELLEEYFFSTVLLPYDVGLRKEQFSSVFEELKNYPLEYLNSKN